LSGAFLRADELLARGQATLDAEVVVVGSGAGGAITAATLAPAHEVLVLEEGAHRTRTDFKMREDLMYPLLYQEGGARMTRDLGIGVFQGRTVGGTTVVNWTTCFRTPARVLEHWRRVHGLGLDEASLREHFEAVESRLSIAEIPIDQANRNNRLLWDGLGKLGLQRESLRRNVKGCMRSGYCGMGCPIDAKQSMLVTYLPDAVAAGARVLSGARVERLRVEAGRVTAIETTALVWNGPRARAVGSITIRPKRVILSCGAIATPALLLRSGLGGPSVPGGEATGRRTFLHPAVGVVARYDEPVEACYGAPQAVASHAHAERGEEMGFLLEAAPVHPLFLAVSLAGFGAEHAERMRAFNHYAAHGGFAIDGFHPSEDGGTVRLRDDGAVELDYPISARLWSALREAMRTLARVNLAAGAREVLTSHEPGLVLRGEADLEALDRGPWRPGSIGVYSFHVMGGARMGDDPARSVVRPSDARHHAVANLHVVDGSLLPTSLGVNPQLTIYGLARLIATRLLASS
jgi:choline dehydrogenase-like flavoprotein